MITDQILTKLHSRIGTDMDTFFEKRGFGAQIIYKDWEDDSNIIDD
jgi:hypothetical protein